MFKIDHNIETNEIVKIDLTAEEIAQREEDHHSAQDRIEKLKLEEKAIKDAKISAYVKLGLTEQEALLLLS